MTYYADPVAQRLQDSDLLIKIGPHGFTHGWVYHGAPGTGAHAAFLRGMADKRLTGNPAAHQHVYRAANEMESGDLSTARQHLGLAVHEARSAGLHVDAHAIQTHANAIGRIPFSTTAERHSAPGPHNASGVIPW